MPAWLDEAAPQRPTLQRDRDLYHLAITAVAHASAFNPEPKNQHSKMVNPTLAYA